MSGILFVVATPIGNLADASPRSLEVLRSADLVACEDTRTTRTLLARYGIQTPTVALHQHNERAASGKLLNLLREGKHLALVSDAGTPALSDPGALLVRGRASRRHPGEPGARPERRGGGIFGGRIRRRPFSVCRLPARLRRSPQEGARGRSRSTVR